MTGVHYCGSTRAESPDKTRRYQLHRTHLDDRNLAAPLEVVHFFQLVDGIDNVVL